METTAPAHSEVWTCMVGAFDGTTAGEVMYTNWDWQTPSIRQFDPPLEVRKGHGFEWRCTWNNDQGDEAVTYGEESTDEMCNLAVVFTPFASRRPARWSRAAMECSGSRELGDRC